MFYKHALSSYLNVSSTAQVFTFMGWGNFQEKNDKNISWCRHFPDFKGISKLLYTELLCSDVVIITDNRLLIAQCLPLRWSIILFRNRQKPKCPIVYIQNTVQFKLVWNAQWFQWLHDPAKQEDFVDLPTASGISCFNQNSDGS